jgi:4-hydroxybenzoate polyprenyltransferase
MLADQSDADRSPRSLLIVDMDGSLVRSDTSLECVVALARRPLALLRAFATWPGGRARVKAELAMAAGLDPARLPYHKELLAHLRDEQAAGRALVLATGADRRIATAVAQHLDMFDAVLASDGKTNLTGAAKLAAIRSRFGVATAFTYVGNSRADLAVWREAGGAICVNAPVSVVRAAAQATTLERSFASEAGWLRPLLRAIRPHQWAKNLLVFVPLVAARAIDDLAGWGAALVAFAAFCATASSVYLINDLLDLAADRQHASKSRRPFASGALPLHIGLIAAPLLLLAGFALSATVGALPLLLLYVILAWAYSLWLKSLALVDVFLLAALYGLRLLSGGVATGHRVSLWLLAFSSFLFLSLAIVKRVAELTALPAGARAATAGRGYRADDVPILQLMGVASSFIAALVLALYVQSELVGGVMKRPTISWIIVPLVLFWECRVWLTTARGGMHEDPVVFAARDWVSWVVAITCFGVLLLDGMIGKFRLADLF